MNALNFDVQTIKGQAHGQIQGSHASWKVLENHFGREKSWKNILENYTLRHFCTEF